MNLQQIEYIVALDKYKSFSKAAEKCFITQATLSTMVKKLEEELDVVIFDRKTTPIITTDSGKEIIAEALLLLNHSNNIKQLSSELHGKIEGELRVGVIPTIAGNLLHRILPQLLVNYPKLKLIVREVNTESIISQLKKGELDVGIVSTPLHNSGLEEDILYYEKLMVYGKLKKSASKYITPKDMSNEKIWLLEQGNCLSNQVMNVCSLSAKQLSQNLDFHPGSFDSLLNLVDSMAGLTLIPELYYDDLPRERKINVTDFKPPYPVREISLVYHRPFAKLRLINALGNEIKSAIAPLLQTSKLKNKDMKIAAIS
jgi:LysR family transcriptional regulator, hydrogen peroxide-inducible genes activator